MFCNDAGMRIFGIDQFLCRWGSCIFALKKKDDPIITSFGQIRLKVTITKPLNTRRIVTGNLALQITNLGNISFAFYQYENIFKKIKGTFKCLM